MKESRYRVAVNDLNKPSLSVLLSILIPFLFACSLAFYILSMPLGDENVSSSSGNGIVQVRPVYTPEDIERLYLIYLPFVAK